MVLDPMCGRHPRLQNRLGFLQVKSYDATCRVQTVNATGKAPAFLKQTTICRVVTIGVFAEQHIEVVRRSLEHCGGIDVEEAISEKKMTEGKLAGFDVACACAHAHVLYCNE